MSLFPANFFAVFFALIALPAFAKPPEFPATPTGFKMGMEVELTPEKLANLMPLFDFEAFQVDLSSRSPDAVNRMLGASNLPYAKFFPEAGNLSKSYLRDNPAAFRALPEKLQEELSRGLNLKGTVIQEKTQLLGLEGKALEKKSSLILPDAPKSLAQAPEVRKLILPTASEAKTPTPVDAALFQSTGGLEVPNRLEWEKLYERWEKLPANTRLASMRLELMGPRQKASFLHTITSFPDFLQGAKLKLKPGVSEKDQEVFSRLEWVMDGDAVEFRHKEPVATPQEFLSDLRHFAGRAGIEREIFDPEAATLARYVQKESGEIAKRGGDWGSFHYHYSLPEDLGDFHRELNLNLFVRRLALGIHSDLGSGGYGFNSDLSARGLTRSYAKGRIEVRAHNEKLEDELGRQFGALFTMDPKAAAEAIAKDTESFLTAEMIEKIAHTRHAPVLRQLPHPSFEKVMEGMEANLAESPPNAIALMELKPGSEKLKSFLLGSFGTVADAIRMNSLMGGAFRHWLAGLPPETRNEFRHLYTGYLQGADSRELSFALTTLSGDEWGLAADAQTKAEFTKFLRKIETLPEAEILLKEILGAGDKILREPKQLLPLLENVLKRPIRAETRARANSFLTSNFRENAEVFRPLARGLMGLPENATKLEVQKAALAVLNSPNSGYDPEYVAGEVLRSQGDLSPELIPAFIAWYKDTKNFDSQLLREVMGPPLIAGLEKELLLANPANQDAVAWVLSRGKPESPALETYINELLAHPEKLAEKYEDKVRIIQAWVRGADADKKLRVQRKLALLVNSGQPDQQKIALQMLKEKIWGSAKDPAVLHSLSEFMSRTIRQPFNFDNAYALMQTGLEYFTRDARFIPVISYVLDGKPPYPIPDLVKMYVREGLANSADYDIIAPKMLGLRKGADRLSVQKAALARLNENETLENYSIARDILRAQPGLEPGFRESFLAWFRGRREELSLELAYPLSAHDPALREEVVQRILARLKVEKKESFLSLLRELKIHEARVLEAMRVIPGAVTHPALACDAAFARVTR